MPSRGCGDHDRIAPGFHEPEDEPRRYSGLARAIAGNHAHPLIGH